MKIIIACDSFKGSLSSAKAETAIADGIRRVLPNADIKMHPIADGGEGTSATLVEGLHGTWTPVTVSDPLGRKIDTAYGILPDGTAVIEMAAAAGLPLLSPEERNPLYTTTYGVGEMIADAIRKGCRKFILGIGGSATNDGGVGCLQALGFTFTDASGVAISPGAVGLADLAAVSAEHALPALQDCTFAVACDVTNPLYGERGCSYIFAPQKGADAAMCTKMDIWLQKFAQCTKKIIPEADPLYPGSGAAGGMGFALKTYLHATLRSGITLVMEQTHLEADIAACDLIITGEGQLDAQSMMGKVADGVSRLAKKYQKPVIAFCGTVSQDAGICNQNGIDAYFPVLRRVATQQQVMQPECAAQNIADTAEQVFRLISVFKNDSPV